MGVECDPGTRDLSNYSNGKLRGMHFKPRGGYTLYHKGQEGRLELTYRELCQLSELIEKMIQDAKP